MTIYKVIPPHYGFLTVASLCRYFMKKDDAEVYLKSFECTTAHARGEIIDIEVIESLNNDY